MARLFCTLLAFCFLCFTQRGNAQQIHSHNDYEKPEPLTAAIRNRAGSIEADVFLVNGQLMVAHSKDQIKAGRTLDSLYLKPIAQLFEQNKGRRSAGSVTSDPRYTFQLLIDCKEDGVQTLKQLTEAVAPYRTYFDRAMNPQAIQLVITGNRPPLGSWVDYPLYIQFDGRPTEVYDDQTLKHVALISDNFYTYSRWNGEGDLSDKDRETLKRFIKRAHAQQKTIRFWATPDTPNAWKQLARIGVDWINTDRVDECAKVIK